MCVSEENASPFIVVKRKRLYSEEVSKLKIPLKTYKVTNDDQRLRLIHKVVGTQQLTIREVHISINIGGSRCWY